MGRKLPRGRRWQFWTERYPPGEVSMSSGATNPNAGWHWARRKEKQADAWHDSALRSAREADEQNIRDTFKDLAR